jgi:hypothetical protein
VLGPKEKKKMKREMKIKGRKIKKMKEKRSERTKMKGRRRWKRKNPIKKK